MEIVVAADPLDRPLAVALDLGSSYVKAGVLDEDGRLLRVSSMPAPPLIGEHGTREGDAAAYVAVARAVLDSTTRRLRGALPLGIASQRSTFVLWSRQDGRPIRPMVSWQDTRGAGWCRAHAGLQSELFARCGLALSGHYVGPKLAAMQQRDPGLAAALRGGDVLFGTLETWLLWLSTPERAHRTDSTMAARTAMFGLGDGAWSEELLARYGVPQAILPRVHPTCDDGLPLDSGLLLTASLADQAAGGLAALGDGGDAALVNLGTGGFVLRPAAGADERVAGFLTAPILDSPRSGCRYVIEGAIGGAGSAVDRFGVGPTALPADDPAPGAFCLPDVAGLGAPHWRPDLRLTLSPAAEALDPASRRRVALEGVLFRVREVLEGLCRAGLPRRILLSGGLAREPFVGAGLAALLGRDVERLEMTEGILTGTARLAAGLDPYSPRPAVSVSSAGNGRYLAEKYGRWSAWLRSLL